MATNFRHSGTDRVAWTIEQLALRLAAEIDRPIPLLVVRTRHFEQVAWKSGKRVARGIERRCLRTFIATARRTLREDDVVAHDAGSADFLAALVAPVRAGDVAPGPSDCRAALARLATAMEAQSGLQFETGWTTLGSKPAVSDLQCALESALVRGARERSHLSFFATLAHELRTPLTSIRGYLETLIEDDLDGETTRRFLETARAEALRMGRLLDGLFDASALEVRLPGDEDATGDLQAALAAALNAVSPIATSRRTVISQFACDLAPIALGTDRMTQILVNVLENAIKHGAEAGRVCVSVAEEAADAVRVCIDDDGPGVPEEERSAIFALAGRGATVRAAGSGLGLALVRLLLERAGGCVEVETSPLGGARFRLRVPLRIA